MSAIYPWQAGLWQSLCHLSQQKRLPHALLLAAPQGLGKAYFARQFAAWRLCEQPSADSVCGVCRSCQLLSTGHHPDLLWVSPDEDDEKGTKASKVIKVAQVRTMVEFATQSAHRQGGQRIVVIEPADALNTASANALLKTLEEPGRDTLFLLLTDKPAALLPTVRSRCQLLPMPLPAPAQALAWLSTQVQPREMAETLLELARGAPLAAAALQTQPWFSARADLLVDLLAVAQSRLMPLQAAQRWQKLDAIEQALAWQSLLDDAVPGAMVADYPTRHSDLHTDMAALLAAASAQALLNTLYEVVEARRLLGTSVQPQAILEGLWLHWGRETRQKRGSHAG